MGRGREAFRTGFGADTMGVDAEETWVIEPSIHEAVAFVRFRFCLSACKVSFLLSPFAVRGIGETTAGVAGAAFGIEDAALCSGFVVRVIFRRQECQKGWNVRKAGMSERQKKSAVAM